MSIISIVEGFAEVSSVPVLLRRLGVEPATPFRVHRNLFVKPGELERTLRLATRARADPSAVLVLLDADDDCPAQLAPALLARARAVTSLPVSVVFAVREIEAWFLGGIESLRGYRGIAADAVWTDDPERPRGAKGRVEEMMSGRGYVDRADQPALMAKLDIAAARLRCPSLDKLLRDLEGFGLIG
ncbi:MAG TPA: DUF4276 family protein [Longimicrobium sp.]